MARKTGNRRSGIFLLELMIAILFFSVASAVCVQVFVKSHQLSLEARQLSEGVGVCSNAAEVIRSADSPEKAEELLHRTFSSVRTAGNGLEAEMEEGILQIRQNRENALYKARISWINSEGSEVYSLTVTRYFPEVKP